MGIIMNLSTFLNSASLQSRTFTSSNTFIIPTSVSEIWATLAGGGGSGGGTVNNTGGAGGGGGAGMIVSEFPAQVVPGELLLSRLV
jgi:uncharacterized spore protein YtfJ